MVRATPRITATIVLAMSTSLALSGCSFVEDLIPKEEQPTVTVFDDPAEDFDKDATGEESNPADTEAENEDIESEQTPSEDMIVPDEETPVEPEPENQIDTLDAAFDYLDEITALASNTCTSQDLLGSTTRVSVTNAESPTDPYSILFIPEANADKPENRAIAYYPENPTNLNPELLSGHNAHSCGLASYYPETLTKAFGEGELSDPLPEGYRLAKTGDRYTITFPDATHLLTASQGLIAESTIVKPNATTTRTIEHRISPDDVKLFKNLEKFIRTSR